MSRAHVSVESIHRYVVKALGGEHLQETVLTQSGIDHDRAFGIATEQMPIAPFGEWTTYEAFHGLDTRPDLGGFSAVLRDDSASPTIEIVHPSGQRLEVGPPGAATSDDGAVQSVIRDWFAPTGGEARLVRAGTHLYDVAEASLTIVNLATVRAIGAALGIAVDPLRFRANVYIDGLPAWAELDLPGRRLQLGGAQVDVFAPVERCSATSVHPTRGGCDINMPRALAVTFGHAFCGVYARVHVAGPLRVGDRFEIGGPAEWDAARLSLDSPDYARSCPRPAVVVAAAGTGRGSTSLELADPFGLLDRAAPGQHLRVHRRDEPVWRNYTVSAVTDGRARITVRGREDGPGSGWVTRLREGDRVDVTGPFGDVLDLARDAPLVLLSAGIGITPTLAMLRGLVQAGTTRRVDVVHVARSAASVPHRDEIERAREALPGLRVHLFLTDPTADGGGIRHRRGRPRAADLASLLGSPEGADVHICGPQGFVTDMRAWARAAGVPAERVHVDPFYSPAVSYLAPRPAPLDGPFTIDYGDGRRLTWTRASGSLVEAAEAAGIPTRTSCRSGVCGTCRSVVRGEVFHTLEPLEELPDGRALACVAVPVSDLEVDLA
ncbi:MOSC domain-containing protein [Geodermatophilus nigrescens]